jgi:hypothetical protein
MNWKRYDESGTRWTWTADEERHLLLFDTASGELREYHEQPFGPVTVHVYRSDRTHIPRDDASPLGAAEHLRTHEVAGDDGEHLRQLNDSKVFEYLEIGKSW